jgi:hypothetical protein
MKVISLQANSAQELADLLEQKMPKVTPLRRGTQVHITSTSGDRFGHHHFAWLIIP